MRVVSLFLRNSLRQGNGVSVNPNNMKNDRFDLARPVEGSQMSIPKATLVLVAQGGPRWSSLQRLLRTIPGVGTLYRFNDLNTLLGNGATLAPTLLLLDFTRPDAMLLTALPQIRARWPQVRLIALTEHETQEQWAEAVGIQRSLPEGVLAATLWETIAALLQESGIKNQESDA